MTEAALSASYRSVFDALDEAFCVIEMIFDGDGAVNDYRFVEVNRAFEVHTGLRDVLGRTVREVLPGIEPPWIETYGQVARSREPIRFADEAGSLHRWFDVYAWPFGRPESQRVALHFADITERTLAGAEARYRSEQFHALVEHAPIGVFLIDAEFRIIQANPVARQVFGDIPDLIGRDYGAVLAIMWPKPFADDIVQLTRNTLRTGVPHHEPERSGVRADRGGTEYYDWRIDRIRLPDGSNGIVCYFIDISDRIRDRQAIAASEERYRTLFESIDEGFCIQEVMFDEHERVIDYRFVEVNPAFERHTGLTNAAGRTIRELVPDIETGWFNAYRTVVLTGEPQRFVDHAQSMGRWFDVYAFRIGEPREHKVAVLFNDITARKRAEHALQESVSLLRHHAHHDLLTGLPNRLQFEQELHTRVATANDQGTPFGVAFLDLDDFKIVNDDLGHESGDTVLIEVARRLKGALRDTDFLARLHGDEFVIILPGLSKANVGAVLGQQLLDVVHEPIEVADTTVCVRASIGFSIYPNDGADPRALLRAADAAMYRAKQAAQEADALPVALSNGEPRQGHEPRQAGPRAAGTSPDREELAGTVSPDS